MHFDDSPVASAPADDDSRPWYKLLNRYHWFVFIVAALGWLFDTMDQQLFNLARKPAITELIGAKPGDLDIDKYAGYATSIFIIGWAIGGLIFGILGDRIGRAKTMILTILLYSAFTGLSAFATSFADFAFYRFLTGLGVGGEFAVGVSLVAEVMPDRARTAALGWLQALSAVGNMMAALISIVMGKLEESNMIASSWRGMFVIGVLPALLTIFIMKRLKEPDRWKAAVAKRAADKAAGIVSDGPKLGSIAELFTDPRWRRNTLVGMLLAFSGVVGLWGIGFFSFDLIRTVFRDHFGALASKDGLTGEAAEKFISGNLTFWSGITSLLLNIGAFFGIYAFSKVTQIIGRKKSFAISFLLAMGSTAFTFWFLDSFYDVFWMIPLMGFCQLTLFGGYAIYFPELFPTRLRSTGISFCYNVGRLVAAVGPSVLGLLTSEVYGHYKATDAALPFRYAGVTMCLVFVIGLLTLPFAPETHGKPLPE
ncbi:MFS transporter [Singulisphaera sp. Ch08]|uniref:MFS transporter n=1 Tax=Singulisphaera sp. Ch08 TaxID=3120278 RepID=A0AAU7CPA3_9BACT